MTKSKDYELITRAIFQTLVDQDEARNIAVEHDVTLSGKFLDHQVDVYWRFESAGIEYSTVVECKDWNRRLEQEKLLAFSAKLEDLNNPKGVMVTRSGYQSGAVEYAKKHGIYLYELFEEPPLTMTEGSFATFKVTPYVFKNDGLTSVNLMAEWTRYEPEYSENKYQPDNEWVMDQIRQTGTHVKDELQKWNLPLQPLSSTKLYDENGNEVSSVLHVFRKKSEEIFHQGLSTGRLVHKFDGPTFFKTGLDSLPFLKITSLSTNITIVKHEPFERAMKMEGFVHFILRNLQDGSERVIAVKKPE